AWRARSALPQWVRCSPRASGSRQASATTCARCRGGNLLGPAGPGEVRQEGLQPAALVAAADPPDRGRVTPQAAGHRAGRLTAGDRQDDAGVLDLAPGQAATASDPLQDRA